MGEGEVSKGENVEWDELRWEEGLGRIVEALQHLGNMQGGGAAT